MHYSRGFSVIGLTVLLSAGIATTAWAATPDAWITTKAKMALLTGEGSALDVNVDTVNGRVTLHGKVVTAEQKSEAEAAVKKLDGVKSVRNLLQVVPEGQQEKVAASDEEIRKNLDKALRDDAGLADSNIDVESVNKGVVLLGGDAKTLSDHLAAVEIAAAVPGVRDVASEIESPEKLADDEIWKDTKTRAGDAEEKSTSTARDLWITSAAKMRLMADGDVPALDINVDTRNGTVTLFGIVPSEAAKASAEADVKKVSGVKQVINDLQVVSESKQEAVIADDEEIARRLTAALDKEPELADIEVEVKNGVVRLTGSVDSGSDRLAAAVLARSTEGVRSVEDAMTIAN